MAIGIVRALVGETTATDSRGNTRVLRVGDAVELNETVQSSAGSTILIQFDNGGFATVGSGDKLFLDQSVIDPTGVTQPVQTAEGNEQSVEDIQAMIAAGMDPTQIAEATAAGADAGTAGDPGQGAHTFVVVNQEAARAEVTPGLATDTAGSTLNTAATQTGVAEPRFLINPDITAEAVNNGPVIDLEASIASGQVREAGVRGDDATLAGDSPNAAYDGQLVASGQIVATDPDGDTLSFAVKQAGTEGEGGASADGQYGSLAIDADGNYVYNLDDRANGLSQGDSVTETFTVMVSDGRGGMVEQEITITVNGTNDAPTLMMGWGATGNGVTEDVNGTGTVSGSWSVTDADADGSRQTISIEGKDGTAGEKAVGDIGDGSTLSFETDYGKLTLNPDGTYSYALDNDNDAVQQLGEGETRTETFEITTTDAHGSSHTQTITVVVTGTNDVPVITEHGTNLTLKEAGVVGNNQDVTGNEMAGDSFTVRDVDAKDSLSATVTGESISGQTTDPVTGVMTVETEYGTLTVTPIVNGDGSVTYQYNFELNAKANSLNEGQDIDYKFDITVSDGKGGTINHPVDVSIEGTNDAPTLTIGWGEAGNSVSEDGTGTVKGSWSVTDADADGGQQALTIAGKDGTTGTGTAGEAGVENASGASFETDYGKLTLNPDGTYSYELKNDSEAIQKMGDGETRTETFEITTTDAHGSTHTQTITVVVTGTNDVPVITEHGSGSLSLKEAGVGTIDQGGKPGWALGDHNHAIAGTSKAESSFTVKDVDAGDKLSARLVDANGNPVSGSSMDANGVITLVTDYGTLTVTPAVNEDGSVTYNYSFELNGNADSLNEGQSFDYNCKIEVSDGHGGTVSENVNIKIDGTNDAPVMRFESVHLKESGEYNGQDTTLAGGNNGFVDKGQHRLVVHGDLSLKASDVDAGAKLTYGIDIKGGDMTLETASTGGKPVTDADGNKVSVPLEVLSNTTVDGIQTIVTNYGTFTLDTATGKYTFELNTSEGSPANELAAGEFLNLGFTSSATDQFGALGQHTVRVTIEGSNDAPTLTVDKPLDAHQNGPVDADGNISVTGQAHGADADHGAKLTYSFGTNADGSPILEVNTPYGTMTIDPNTGEYKFVVKGDASAFDDLNGQDASLNFKVQVSDEHGAHSETDVTVNVHPNHAPEILPPAGGADDNDLSVKESGQVARGDGVPNNGFAEGNNQTKAPGVLTDDGSFTVKDQDKGDTLKAALVDAQGQPVDGVVTNPETGVMTLVTEYGTLTVTPVDHGDGTVTYNYHFELNNNGPANNLAQGEHADLDFYIQVSDGNGASVTQDVNVRVEGTNDAPKIVYDNIHMKEDGVYNGNQSTTEDSRDQRDFVFEQNHRTGVKGQLQATDPDHDAVLTFGVNVNSTDKDGINQSGIEVSVYTGEGKNTKPVIDADGHPMTETVRILDSKFEGNEQVIQTNYGELRVNTVTGEYTFTLNSDASNHLGAGEKIDFHFTTTATDQHGAQGHHNLNVIIEGANDAPTLSLDNPGTGVSDSVMELVGEAHGADVDNGAKLSYSFGEDSQGNPVLEKVTEYGKITIDPVTGRYSYVLNTESDAYKGLAGSADSENIIIRVTDEHGAYSEQDLTVNVSGNSINITANEAGLNDVGNTSEITAVTVPDGFEIVGVKDGGKYGSVAYNEDTKQWEYKLEKAYGHQAGDGANTALGGDTITLTIKGADGNTHDVQVKVDIVDDVPEIHVRQDSDNGLEGVFTLDYGADGKGGSSGQDIFVKMVDGDRGDDGWIKLNDSGKIPAGEERTLYFSNGVLTFSQDADGQFHYSFKPNPGHENDRPQFEISATDKDGDTTIGKIEIDPSVTPPVPENHAPEFGGAKADVNIVSTTTTELTSGDRILAGKLTGNSHTEGVSEYKGDPNDPHAIFKDHNNGVSFDEAVSNGKSVGTVAEYLELINSENCPDVIVLGGSDKFIIGEDFRIPEGVTLIVNGNLEIENGAKFNSSGGQDTAFDGLLYVNGNMDVTHGSFHLGAGPHILVKGEFEWQGSIKVDGQVETTVETNHAEVQIDLNEAFTDPDSDSLSFSYDRGTLPDGYEIIIENGVLKIVGTEGSHFGTQTVIVTADDGHGGSTSASLTITVNNDSETGTVVMGPPVLPPATDNGLPDVPDVNHAPDIGDVSATVIVDHETITINAGGAHGVTDNSAIIVGNIEKGNGSIGGVKVDGTDTGHLFEKYVDADLGTVKDSAHRVDSLDAFKLLMESGNAPKVIILGNGEDSFSLPNDFKVPEGTILIIDGNINVNGAATLLNEPFGGMLYVTGDLNVPYGSLTVYNQYGSGFMLVEGSLNYEGSIHAVGNIWQNPPHVSTTIDTDTTRLEMNLNNAFKDADGDKLTFTVDNSSLPDGVSIVNGVLTILGKDGVALGHQTVTVTATDDKGASTSVSFEFNVNGNQVDVTASPVDHTAMASSDTMMLSTLDTGTEHVTDAITHQPLDGNHHADTVDGMIAAADTIEHGTAGHDMLSGSHGNDVLYGEGGHDLMAGDGSGTTVDALAGLVHTDSSSESVLNTIHSMSPEQLKGLSDGLESLEHHNDGNDLLVGSAGHDVLIGMGGNDVLHGGEGNDILLGGSGDDILVGGQGDDVLVGGSGHDTFQYHQGDLDGVVNGDHIADFHLGNLDASKGPVDANADVLDIGDLLLASGAKADGSDLFSGGFLNLEVLSHDEEKGTATIKLSIDQDGSAGGEHGSVALATIDMNGVRGLGGLNPQDQAEHLMQQLMNNDSIKI